MENRTELMQTQTALKTQQQKSCADLALIVVELGKLAMLLGEPINPDRQQLLTEELSDLPVEALLYAIDRWKKGDRSHLSEYEQQSTRVGVFFPKPAELRDIAKPFMRDLATQQLARETREAREREARMRAEHPEQYEPSPDVQAALDALNKKFEMKRVVPIAARREYVELPKEEVLRMTAEDLEALAKALRTHQQRHTLESA
jgi:hypothetical protein